MEINIPILSRSDFDLTLFDFSFKDIQILDIQSFTLRDYIANLDPKNKDLNLSTLTLLKEESHPAQGKKYAIVKTDPRKDFNYEDIFNVWRFLIVLFPSDLQIEHMMYYFEVDGVVVTSGLASYEKKISNPAEPLTCNKEDVPEINVFLKAHFGRMKSENYIGLAIDNYLTSFDASHSHFKYLSLCIALECTIGGETELNYRLKRTIAILLGESFSDCETISKKISECYKLRSKIVHGESYVPAKMILFTGVLRTIISRTIIELLIHNFQTNKELDQRITTLGYGDQDAISPEYEQYILNRSVLTALKEPI